MLAACGFRPDTGQANLEGGRIGKLLSPRAGGPLSIMCVDGSRFLSDGFVAFWANTDPRSDGCHVGVLTKTAN